MNPSALHLDWLDFTVPLRRLQECMDYLVPLFDDPGEPVEIRGRRYDRGFHFPSGGGVYFHAASFDSTEDPAIPEALINLKGATLSTITVDQQFELARWLSDLGDVLDPADRAKVTHFDIAFDDFEWIKTPDAIWAEYALPFKFAPFLTRFHGEGGSEKTGDGCTVNFGRRGKQGSGCQVSIYDKNAESSGLLNCCRYEVRWYDEKCEAAWSKLMGNTFSVEEFTARLGNIVGGSITFFENADDKNAPRRKVAPFWLRVLDRLGSVSVKLGREEPDNLSDVRTTLVAQAAPRLWACFEDVRIKEGDDAAHAWLRSVLSDGERRAKPALKKLISKRPEKVFVWNQSDFQPPEEKSDDVPPF